MDSEEFKDDLDEVIDNCKKEGVKVILTAGIDKRSNRKALELSEKYDIVKPTLGVYPQDALSRECNEEICDNIDEEIEFIKENKDKIMGIGEVGLDFLDDNADKEKQKEVFVKMINLSKELDKPIIVHSRKAEHQVLQILKDQEAKKVVLHCFMGRKQLIKDAMELGYYFSVPPNIVRAHNFRHLVQLVNINQILTETDAPYLGPVREQRNDSSNIKYSIKEIAELKGFEKEEVANNIFMNYQRLFL